LIVNLEDTDLLGILQRRKKINFWGDIFE